MPLDPSVIGNLQTPKSMSLSDLLNVATGTQQYKQQAMKTQQGYQDTLNQTIDSLSQDPDIMKGQDANAITSKIAQARDLAISRGVPVEIAEKGAANLISQAHQNPASVIDSIGNLRRSMISPAQVQTNINNQTQVGGRDIYGNPTSLYTNPNTGAVTQLPLQFQQAQGGGSMRYAPGESADTVAQFTQDRQAAQNAVLPAKTGLNNIEKIQEVLPMAETGDYAGLRKTIQSLGGSIAGDKPSEISAAAYDIINKNVADLANAKSSALGSKFATQIESVKDSLANADKNPTAIKSTLQQLQPLLQHAVNYQAGLEKTLANHGGDVQYSRQYNNAINSAFDPQTLMAYNEYKAHGASGLQQYAKQHNLDPQTLIQNLTTYNNLVTKGL